MCRHYSRRQQDRRQTKGLIVYEGDSEPAIPALLLPCGKPNSMNKESRVHFPLNLLHFPALIPNHSHILFVPYTNVIQRLQKG